MGFADRLLQVDADARLAVVRFESDHPGRGMVGLCWAPPGAVALEIPMEPEQARVIARGLMKAAADVERSRRAKRQ